jgi:cell division protein FtsI (penicillin-binding protein 3)
VQMVAAFAAVANGGRLMQPQIVRAILDDQGREVQSFEPKAIRQVISPETARVLTGIMTKVVSDGTGHNAAIAGFEVAGKTGTAQKMDPATRRYSRAPGVLSFVGFVPADDPRLAMLVLLDEPKNEKWGSEAAAPIFAAIGAESLRYLHAPPKGTAPVQIIRELPGEPQPHTADSRVSLRPAPPLEIARLASACGSPCSEMPSLVGFSLRQAMQALAPLGVRLEVAGRGVVSAQAPAPGAALAPGALARLTLQPPSARR